MVRSGMVTGFSNNKIGTSPHRARWLSFACASLSVVCFPFVLSVSSPAESPNGPSAHVEAAPPISPPPTAAIASVLCKAPRDLVRLTIPLEAVKNAIARDGDFRIVALGSSSTQGAGASSPKMCYPAQLEAELNRRFHPDKHFEVANLGVGGEMAGDMLARLDRDVLPLKPDLVLWQTGVNDALTGRPIDEFRTELVQGIDAIRNAGADVILLDLQYYPRSERVEGYKNYLHTMWSVAQEKSVPVLKRHAFMKHLVDSRQFTASQLLAPDLFHLNDLSYRCLGNLVADAIGDGLEQASRPHQRSKTASMR